MSRYVITISTEAYKPMRASTQNWERGTINDFMEALNGYKVVETSLEKVMWRLQLFNGAPYDEYNFRERMEWLDNPKSKAKITFFDKLCGFERTEYVKPYGFTQGYFDKCKIIRSLKNNGYVKIPFEWTYDPRQSNYKRFKGCYMQIVKR